MNNVNVTGSGDEEWQETSLTQLEREFHIMLQNATVSLILETTK